MNKKEFAEKRHAMSQNSIPKLINLLEDEILETRFLAEMCLRDATDTWLSFQPASSPQARRKAIEEWRDWWREKNGKFKKKWNNSSLKISDEQK